MIRTLMIIAILISSATSSATQVWEAGLTYQWQKSPIGNPAPYGDSTAKMEGFGLSFRWAYLWENGVFLGADMHYHFPRYKDEAASYNTSTSNFDFGPTVGGKLPFAGLRVWATYIAFGEIDPIGNKQLNYLFVHPEGYRIGLGIPVLQASLNIQYQETKYRTTRFENSTQFGTSSTDGVKFDGSGLILSLSWPWEH